MSERKINLEEILLREFAKSEYGYPLLDYDVHLNIISAIKEACKQTLELAAENAEWDDLGDGDLHGANIEVDKQSILNVINLIE